MAVWCYEPGYANGSSPFSCNECMMSVDDPIGCSCNWNYAKPQEGLPTDLPEGIEGKDWKWVEWDGDEYTPKITKEEGYWVALNEYGKPYPCVEYDYDEDGFDYPTIFNRIKWWFKIAKLEIRHHGFIYYLKNRKIRW